MNKKTIYIAGKVTGETRLDVLAKFAHAETLLQEAGYEVVNPIRVVNDWDATWDKAMRKCIQALMGCDAILPLPCTADSKGASIELALAKQLGMEVVETTIQKQ